MHTMKNQLKSFSKRQEEGSTLKIKETLDY